MIHSLPLDLSLERLRALFAYQPESPMLFSTGLFFFLFIAFYIGYRALRHTTTARILYVVLFSLYFYYKSSGVWFLLLVFTATSDFLIARALAATVRPAGRKAWVALSLVINLGMLAYFKYTNFLLQTLLAIGQSMGSWFGVAPVGGTVYEPLDIFLPVGISFFTFQSLSYTIDVYRGELQPLRRWIDYLFYVSFFPGLVAGPIVRARDFIPQMFRTPVVTRETLGEGLYLIICGLLKKSVISDYISVNFVDRIFDAPTLYTGLENLVGAYGYALQIYCDFSGYSDMAIGIALLLGIRFNTNFDSPYQSATITEFWRRWHISLSTWLKDYLYISLGGNRRGRVRTYVNLMLTMLPRRMLRLDLFPGRHDGHGLGRDPPDLHRLPPGSLQPVRCRIHRSLSADPRRLRDPLHAPSGRHDRPRVGHPVPDAGASPLPHGRHHHCPATQERRHRPLHLLPVLRRQGRRPRWPGTHIQPLGVRCPHRKPFQRRAHAIRR